MDQIRLQTPLGPLPFVGRLHTGRARPALLVVRGIYPPADQLHDLVDQFSDCDVLIGDLPGMRTPLLAQDSIEAFTQAYAAAVERLFGRRPLVALGVSTGALVTLGLKSPQIQVALEPFFSTAKLHPLTAVLRAKLAAAPDNQRLRAYLFQLFGVSETGVVDRDYGHLLEALSARTHVLAGNVPLHAPRAPGELPSLVDDEARRRLATHPQVTIHDGPPGTPHHFTGTPEGEAILARVLERALDDLALAA